MQPLDLPGLGGFLMGGDFFWWATAAPLHQPPGDPGTTPVAEPDGKVRQERKNPFVLAGVLISSGLHQGKPLAEPGNARIFEKSYPAYKTLTRVSIPSSAVVTGGARR
jgi:hypothetical protein